MHHKDQGYDNMVKTVSRSHQVIQSVTGPRKKQVFDQRSINRTFCDRESKTVAAAVAAAARLGWRDG